MKRKFLVFLMVFGCLTGGVVAGDVFKTEPVHAVTISKNPVKRTLTESEINVVRNRLYTQINSYRKSNKRSTLSKQTALIKSATVRAKELKTKFSHTRPNGKSWTTTFPKSSGSAKGENLSKVTFTAKSSYSTREVNKMADSMFNALKASSSHRTVMLNKKYTKYGIGMYVVKSGNYITIYSAQHFCSK